MQLEFFPIPAHCKSGKQLAAMDRAANPIKSTAEPEVAPRQHHSPTSCTAADSVTPHLPKMQLRVFEWLQAHGPATDNEIIIGVGGNPNGPRARRIELLKKGLIEACEESRNGSQLWRVK